MLELGINEGVALIRMAHPKVNAFSPAFCDALREALTSAEADSSVGALVIASAAPGVFSAGLDLKALGPLGPAEMEAFASRFFGLIRRLCTGPLPVVAALEGHAIAGGALMLCAVDRRVAAEGEYRVGLTEVALGLPLPGGMTELVRRVLGQRAATEVLCFGGLHGPGRALELGFADRMVPAGQALEAALGEARQLAALSRGALGEIRRGLKGDIGDRLVAMEQAGYAEFLKYWFAPECTAARAKALQPRGSR